MSVPIIYVGGLNPQSGAYAVGRLFERFGDVTSARIQTQNGVSRGFGFLEMSTSAAADQAIRQLNGTQLEGSTIRVEYAHNQRAARQALLDDSAQSDQAPPATQAPRRQQRTRRSLYPPYRPNQTQTQQQALPAAPAGRTRRPTRQNRRRRGAPASTSAPAMYPYPMVYAEPVAAPDIQRLMQTINSMSQEIKQLRAELHQAKQASGANATTKASKKQSKQEKTQKEEKPKQTPRRQQRRRTRRPVRNTELTADTPTLPTTVFVGRFPTTITTDQFRAAFKDLPVKNVRLPQNPFNTTRSAGYGYVDFNTPEEQTAFLAAHKTITVEGTECRVQPAIDQEKLRAQRASADAAPAQSQ